MTEQTLDKKQKALVEEAYDRLAIWQRGCQEIHDRARDARKILLLQDPYQDDEESETVTLQLQTLKSTFVNCVADQMDNMPEAYMIPERQDLEGVAEDLTDVVRYILAINNYELQHRKRVEDCFGAGTAITQVAWDEDMDGGEGNVAVLRWPIEAFLWDPTAESLQEARALFKVSWHPLSWFEQHYPDEFPYIGAENGEFYGIGVPDAQEDAYEQTDEERALLVEYWYRMYDAKTRKYKINVAYLAGGALLSLNEGIYDHGMYPFIPDVYTPIEGLPVGDGMIQELAPMMRYINKYAAYIDMNLRMSSKGRLLIDRNAGIDKKALADWSQDIIEGNRIDPSALQWLQNAPFTSMVTQQMFQLQMDLKQDSGQSQFTRGETAGGVTAASAISALQEAGGKITRLRTHVFNQGFRAMVEQVMWLVSQFYSKKRVIFITGAKDKPSREIVASPEYLFGKKGKALPAPPYTVQVQVQRRNPLRVQAQNELFMQAYSMAAQAQQIFPLSVLFELLNVDGKERILPVLRQSELITQQMQQLAQQNEQLQIQNEQLSVGISNLQKVNAKYVEAMRGQMFPQQDATDQALPTGVNGQMAM